MGVKLELEILKGFYGGSKEALFGLSFWLGGVLTPVKNQERLE